MSRSLRLYQEHGQEGLQSHTYNWTAEQKYQVIQYMRENHLSCQETGIQFGISGSSTIWQWEQRYLKNGIEGLENKKKGRKPRTPKPKPPKTREEELLDENLYLRAENEYLKKLNALVAERKNRKRERGAVISELRQKYPLALLLIIARIPRSSYYYHLKRLGEPQKHLKEREAIEVSATSIKAATDIGDLLQLRHQDFRPTTS